MKYITYRIQGLGINTPIAIEVGGNQDFAGHDVFFDACSLAALKNVRWNNCGRIRKDAIVISILDHYKYKWEELEMQYYNKYYNPKNFAKETKTAK